MRTSARFLLCLASLPAGWCPAADFQEAPRLAAQVQAGTLPPVAERLPDRPLLVQPVEKIGRYGGAWRTASIGGGNPAFFYRQYGYEPLLRWDPQWRRVIPGVAERWEVNADATRFTFHLRPGLRWSDGHPFTAADILFWREHVLAHPNASRSPLDWLSPGGELPAVTAPDAYTVVFTFSRPHLLFERWLATPHAAAVTSTPRHVLASCFPALNPRAEAEARRRDIPDAWTWYQWLWASPHLVNARERAPALGAWQLDRTETNAAGRIEWVARRNPYYWKIDPAGQQLPYLDELRIVNAESVEDVRTLVLAGELHYQDQHLGSRAGRSALQAAAQAGRIRLRRLIPAPSNVAAISLNLTHPDPVLRGFFNQHEVRVALSLAIDRPRIVRELLSADSKPYQVAPLLESGYYHDRLASQHLQHDRPEAERKLAAAGHPVDGQGRRLANGQPLEFEIMVATDVGGDAVEMAAALARDWRALGLEVRVRGVSSGEYYALKARNEHDVALWSGDGGLDPLLDTRFYVPTSTESNYAIPWARWRQGGGDPQAEEPPPAVLQLYGLYDDLLLAPDEPALRLRFARLLDASAEQFLVIGVATPGEQPAVIHPALRNVPVSIYFAWNYPQPGPVNPAQFFLEP